MYNTILYLLSKLFGKSSAKTIHVRRESFVDDPYPHKTTNVGRSQIGNLIICRNKSRTGRVQPEYDEEYKEEPLE